MKKSEATALVAVLMAAFPRQPLGDETPGLYARMLSDLPAEAARLAVDELIATSRFFPTIAEIRERVAITRVGAPPAEEAWGEVLRAIKRFGRGGSPPWSAPAIARAVDCLGWIELCNAPEGDAPTRARFIEAYKSQATREVREAQVAGVLPPVEERRRIASGEPVPAGAVARLVAGRGA